MDTLRSHQQNIPRSDVATLSAIGIAMLSLNQQTNVVFQMEMPGKGEATVLGIDQANAGQAALDVSDVIHDTYCSATHRTNLG